jgi:hypothetical protein
MLTPYIASVIVGYRCGLRCSRPTNDYTYIVRSSETGFKMGNRGTVYQLQACL